ncbi:hypothetical protein V2G26_019604 [Clonostachys chloroleuca]
MGHVPPASGCALVLPYLPAAIACIGLPGASPDHAPDGRPHRVSIARRHSLHSTACKGQAVVPCPRRSNLNLEGAGLPPLPQDLEGLVPRGSTQASKDQGRPLPSLLLDLQYSPPPPSTLFAFLSDLGRCLSSL